MPKVGQTEAVSGAKSSKKNSATSYDMNQWLHKQWEKGATIWTVPHANSAAINH